MNPELGGPDEHFVDDPKTIEAAEAYRRRKQTAVLAIVFADIAESTRQREELGEVDYEDLREDFETRFHNIISADDLGSVVKGTGDGALSVFSEPSAAVERCLEVQRALADHPFKVRIGIDMGQVSVKSSFGIVADVFGRQVNRAARVEALAEPGHILTSFHVYDCAVGWLRNKNIRWHNHGKHPVKGFADEISIYEVFDHQRLSAQSLARPHTEGATNFLVSYEADLEASLEKLDPGLRRSIPVYSRIESRREPIPRTLGPEDWQAIRKKLAKTPISVGAPPEFFEVGDPFSTLGDFIEDAAKEIRRLINSKPRILWVDDHPQNNALEQRILEKAGVEIDLALTTASAIEHLAASDYFLVITDMGRGTDPTAGLELMSAMKHDNHSLPVILYASPDTVARLGEEARARGCVIATAGLITLLGGIGTIFTSFKSYLPLETGETDCAPSLKSDRRFKLLLKRLLGR